MTAMFVPLDTLSFPTWLPLWLEYLGSRAPDVDARNHEATFARLTDPSINLHGIAAVTEQAIGFAHFYYHPSTWATSENCCLQDLYVAPSAPGQRVGKALIDAMAAIATQRGCPVLHWRTRESNVAAQAVYSQFAERTDFISYRLVL